VQIIFFTGINIYCFISVEKNTSKSSIGSLSLIFFLVVLHPNPEGFVYMSWKEREGRGMEGRKQ